MDGTLTQTNQLIFASFNHVAQKYLGKTLTPGEIISLFGPPEEGGLSCLLGPDRVVSAMDDLCCYYRAHHKALARVHAGIHATLMLLQQRGVRLAVFTGKGNRTTAITLQEFDLASYFELVVSGSDVENHKPHPEGIKKVMSAFSLSPGEVLMVGDAVADIHASRAAGVRVAAALWDSYDRERVLNANADLVFHRVDDMLLWFREHLN